MKKIRSFMAALLLVAVLAASVHSAASGISLKVENGRFGLWFNPYKDLSYSALAENISSDTVMVMGSSEFRHGRRSKYHPLNALRTKDIDILTIGGPCNQILYHCIAAGSLEDKLKKRKVILLISPTWFKKEGVSDVNYGLRFSESEYIRFMQNPDISLSAKKYAAKRSAELLQDNIKYRKKLKEINDYLVYGKRGYINRILFKAEEASAFDKDRVTAAAAIRKISRKEARKITHDDLSSAYFDELEQKAQEDSLGRSDNPLNISDKSWNRSFERKYKIEKGMHKDCICSDSREFDDLKEFLEVCSETGLKAKIIIMPVNGKWYDHVGTGRRQRRETTDKILAVAKEYGAETADLTVHEYEPFITKDSNHPWNRGWVLIDREIYSFCSEDKKGS